MCRKKQGWASDLYNAVISKAISHELHHSSRSAASRRSIILVKSPTRLNGFSNPQLTARFTFENTPTMDMDDSKGQQQPLNGSGFGQDTPPRSDIDEILRRKRKAREYKVWRARFR